MKQQVNKINMNEKEDEVEINLLDLFNYYRKKIIFIIIGFVVGAIIAGLGTKFLITPKYTATAKVYMVSASNNSVVNLADLSIGTSLSEDYAELLHVRPIVEAVSKENDLGYSYEQLNGMISISTVEDTRILKISAVSTKPKEAKIIANALAEKAVTEIPKLMGTTAPNIAERAITPKFKSSPSLKKNTMLGALGGMVLVLAVLTFLFITDDTIKTEEDIELRGLRENPEYKNPKLNCVRTALERMIKGYSNLRIELAPARMVMTNADGVDLQIDQLSGGYKAVLSVIADIAKRLSMANPDSQNPDRTKPYRPVPQSRYSKALRKKTFSFLHTLPSVPGDPPLIPHIRSP